MRFAELPRVTIQLPIFNERFVVERLLEETAKIDYPRAPAADPGAGRFHRRYPSVHRRTGPRVSRCRAAHRVHPPDQSSRIQGWRARKRAEDRHRRSGRRVRRRFRSARRFPAAHRASFHRSQGRHGADALDVSEPRPQRPDRSAGHPARRPLRAGAHRALRRRAVFQLQRHRRHPAAVDDPGCRAAGSTTRSPKIPI